MKFKKNVIIICITFFTLFSSATPLLARNAVYDGEDYTLNVSYNDTVHPGEAIFITLKYTPSFSITSLFSQSDKYSIQATAKLMSAGSREILRKTELFTVKDEKQNLFGYIPLSTWYTPGNFSIKIIYQIFETNKNSKMPLTQKMEFEIPLHLNEKKFNAETIALDATNTAIKTNSNTKRVEQINTLNDVIQAVNSTDVYQLTNFTSPVESTRRTAFFGDRRTYAYSNGTSSSNVHYGIDFGIPTGTPVHACGTGKVVLTENRITTGYTVVIEHLPGVYSLYYHLSKYSVKIGQMVKQGDQIAESGSTGLATGPHLHWEMRMNGNAVSPDWFLTNFAIEEKEK